MVFGRYAHSGKIVYTAFHCAVVGNSVALADAFTVKFPLSTFAKVSKSVGVAQKTSILLKYRYDSKRCGINGSS